MQEPRTGWIRIPPRQGGIGGGNARDARDGSWAWNPVAHVIDGCAQSTAGPALAPGVGTASLTYQDLRQSSGRVEKADKGGGPGRHRGEAAVTPVVAPAPLPGFAVRGEKAHSNQSAVRRSSTVPPSRRGIAGNPARRLGWRPAENTKGRLGPSRRGRDLSKVLRTQQEWRADSAKRAARLGQVVRAGLLGRPFRLDVLVLKHRS